MDGKPILDVAQVTKRFPAAAAGQEPIVALDKVSFSLDRGEILGIIGHNGAGKTTLLKILSEITPPSEGTIAYEGQLTSILEVGTGFHPDLSGRENIFLSASLLGYSKAEIQDIYPTLVAFSGLEAYLDMPVKHYSSGMYLRLAFSIAFHARIDILLVDEVLAVGDADFRRRCYQRIRDIAAAGCSIILVTHSTQQVTEFCHRCLLLESGKLIAQGAPLEVIETYLERPNPLTQAAAPVEKTAESIGQNANAPIALQQVSVHSEASAILHTTAPVTLELLVEKAVTEGALQAMVYLTDMNEQRVLMDANALHAPSSPEAMPAGAYRITCTLPANLLNRGIYTVGVVLCLDMQPVAEYPEAKRFKLVLPDNSPHHAVYTAISCSITPPLSWSLEPV
ncbi:MAG: ABC transporter ATP-binding protein, partial [Bacteroidota bacterium]